MLFGKTEVHINVNFVKSCLTFGTVPYSVYQKKFSLYVSGLATADTVMLAWCLCSNRLLSIL